MAAIRIVIHDRVLRQSDCGRSRPVWSQTGHRRLESQSKIINYRPDPVRITSDWLIYFFLTLTRTYAPDDRVKMQIIIRKIIPVGVHHRAQSENRTVATPQVQQAPTLAPALYSVYPKKTKTTANIQRKGAGASISICIMVINNHATGIEPTGSGR